MNLTFKTFNHIVSFFPYNIYIERDFIYLFIFYGNCVGNSAVETLVIDRRCLSKMVLLTVTFISVCSFLL